VIPRRTFLCGLTRGTLAAPLTTEARQAKKTALVGVLTRGRPPLWTTQGVKVSAPK